MPCPYFIPSGQMVWPNAPKLPLGDAYTGTCQADAGGPVEPGFAMLKDLCNLGYARGRCEHFPQDAGADAVRFTIAKHDAGVIRIQWVREKDHHPLDHGLLDYSLGGRSFTGTSLDDGVLRQAEAYVASYLRRKQICPTES
jgi:hypothetical protein